ncbi:hypothetical protein J437_LFUL002240 [Ladona fulva]|uniref:Uncharacterized protein n=1 Tax=Ladona fulva TaxID=123851 RepID=A0A8K0NU70_LADFU|nr:hypothetical protein J437_LFUL002240 [Ladona fulva]
MFAISRFILLQHGEIQCRPVQCPALTCKNPVYGPKDCCPTCLKQCYMRGVLYEHGESVNLRQCIECECQDGYMPCKRIDPETRCPPLTCPPRDQFTVPGECCKFCPDTIRTIFSDRNATDRDIPTMTGNGWTTAQRVTCATSMPPASTCRLLTPASATSDSTVTDTYVTIAFSIITRVLIPTRILSSDIDECLEEGGLHGHHCHSNTRCVNVPGSYICDCLPGYKRVDRFNCAEHDECESGEHKCHEHATCTNTAGGYLCECAEGYEGDGFTCRPVCNQTCANGGECVAPGHCACRRGYVGKGCEADLDECALGLHECRAGSECVNMPGWYYCQCRAGYRRTVAPPYTHIHPGSTMLMPGVHCQDVDECLEGTHTCHGSAECINTEGGFRCSCSPGSEDCSLGCIVDGIEVEDGATVSPKGSPCKRCTCHQGIVTCEEPRCECGPLVPTSTGIALSDPVPSSSLRCCPQCDASAACRHQELHHVLFRSGERWIYQCQTCECLFGEVDCWPLECPPLTCQSPVLSPGDCCPRCEDDPCGPDLEETVKAEHNSSPATNTSLPLGRPCTYAGRLYASGHDWKDPYDKCTTCRCRNGHLCCSFDFQCSIVLTEHNNSENGVALNHISNGSEREPANLSIQNGYLLKPQASSKGDLHDSGATSKTSISKDIRQGAQRVGDATGGRHSGTGDRVHDSPSGDDSLTRGRATNTGGTHDQSEAKRQARSFKLLYGEVGIHEKARGVTIQKKEGGQ